MAGYGNYLDVLLALNQAFPDGGNPVMLPPARPGGPVLPIGPVTAPPEPGPTFLTNPMPEMPPAAPMPALDQSLVGQYQGLAGPEPTRPVIQPATTLDKVAAALGGISAGLQGRAPEYVASLREQRERPMREYEAKKERYDAQRTQLGILDRQAAERKAEREQARAQTVADRNFEIELNERARQLGLRDQKEIEMLRDTLLTRRQREEREAEEKAQKAKYDQQYKIEKAKLRKGFLDQLDAKDRGYADELARYSLGEIDTLSPGALKANTILQAKLRRLQGGPGNGSGGAVTWAELSDGSVVPASAVKLEVLPAGVTVKRLFATGAPQLPGSELTADAIDATLANDKTDEERNATIASLRSRGRTAKEKAIIEERIKAAKPIAPPSPGFIQRGVEKYKQVLDANPGFVPRLSP